MKYACYRQNTSNFSTVKEPLLQKKTEQITKYAYFVRVNVKIQG